MMTPGPLPDAYPLQWPAGWERTKEPKDSPYGRTGNLTEGRVRDELLDSIRKLGGALPIISSNMTLRIDGLPYANQRIPDDGGIAVYWVREGKQEVMACDRWKRPWENMRAIYIAIEGMRAMDRAGATQILNRAFQAFQLPAEGGIPWREVFDIASSKALVTFDPLDSEAALRKAFKRLSAHLHPDVGGEETFFKRLGRAFEEGLRELRA